MDPNRTLQRIGELMLYGGHATCHYRSQKPNERNTMPENMMDGKTITVTFLHGIGDLLTVTANRVLFPPDATEKETRRRTMFGGASRPLVATVITQMVECCSGGIQLMYGCRIANLDDGHNAVYVKPVSLHEHELMPYPEPAATPEPLPDTKSG